MRFWHIRRKGYHVPFFDYGLVTLKSLEVTLIFYELKNLPKIIID